MTDPAPRFVLDGPADIAVIVVTYNSAGDIAEMLESLRAEAADLRLRAIVVDNASADGTLEQVRRFSDVVALSSGGNLGYAGGINAARGAVHPGEDILVLNPDLRVERGAVARLRAALHADDGIGVVAPRILDDTGRTTDSLHNEPTAWRALVDAVLGPLWRRRPAALSEWVRDEASYESPRDADWASGAALLIRAAVAARVGEWDERFFLYSEETDYCRRVRDAGYRIRFEPSAVVRHSQGGSGTSDALAALLNVNRVRYVRKHAPARAGAYRRAALVGAGLRALRSPSERVVARFLRSEALWEQLPRATWAPVSAEPVASVIIPAHNEGTVITRTLGHLAAAAGSGALEVHVACNGCDDDTADRARAVPGVRVLELATPSKVGALNAGNAAASRWPRIYLDADIDLPPAAVPGLVRALERDGALGGRPPFEYDTLASSPLVRAYYRARLRMPHLSEALWGAGVYALTARGAERVGGFPAVTADDVYVDSRLSRAEKAFPLTPPVRVRMPRTTGALVAILTRARRGAAEQGIDDGSHTARALAGTIRGPVSLFDAGVYAALTVYARRRAARSAARWERDDSTRAPAAVPTPAAGRG